MSSALSNLLWKIFQILYCTVLARVMRERFTHLKYVLNVLFLLICILSNLIMVIIQFQINSGHPSRRTTLIFKILFNPSWILTAKLATGKTRSAQSFLKMPDIIGPLLVEFSLNQEALKFHRLIAERNKWSIFPAWKKSPTQWQTTRK